MHELIRHAVEIVIDLDVIIDVHATRLPFRQLVPRARQRLQRWAIDLLEEHAPAHPQGLHWTVVDGVEPRPNRRIEVRQREEGDRVSRRKLDKEINVARRPEIVSQRRAEDRESHDPVAAAQVRQLLPRDSNMDAARHS